MKLHASTSGKAKHVLVVNATKELGGIELHCVALAEFLANRGHQVTVAVVGRDYISNRVKGLGKAIEVVHASDCPYLNLSFSDASRLLKKLPADVCVFQKGSFDSGSLGMDMAARLRYARYISVEQLEAAPLPPLSTRRHFWGLFPGIGWWWYRLRLEGYLRSLGPHATVAVSAAVKGRLESQYWFPSRKLSLAPNGVSVERFCPNDNARQAQRMRWSIPSAAFVFGAVGRFSEVKGFDDMLRMFAAVARAATQDVRLVLVGQGPEEAALRNQTRELGLGDRVTFAPFSDTPWEAMNAFDSFVLPSRNEGLPFALMEAMACGCCCIAMRVGGVGELLSEGRFGWLVEAGNEQEFMAAMRDVIKRSHSDRRDMGMLARARIIDGFTQADQLSKIATLIEA